MIELLIVWPLCRVNRRYAQERGRSKGAFTALTILLWLVPEVLAVVGGYYARLPFAPYFLGLLLGGVGGTISYFAAKNCKQYDPLKELAE